MIYNIRHVTSKKPLEVNLDGRLVWIRAYIKPKRDDDDYIDTMHEFKIAKEYYK